MNIPQGYKQTELGIIPEDWEVVLLGSGLRFQTGYPFQSSYFNGDGMGVRLIRNRDLKSDDSITHYSGAIYNEFIVNNYDILIGMDGDFMPCVWDKGIALLNQRVGRLVVKNDWSPRFLFYALQEPLKQKEQGTGATTVKHLSHSDIERISMSIPPSKEQKAIAEALSDVDGLIAALDKKIAKKRLLKQGAMCKLLSLSGRGKKWFNTKLGNVVSIRKGSMLTSDRFVAGNIPVIAGGKIPAGYHNVANRPANTITISASGASAGYVALYNKPIFATDCSTIEPCSTYDIHYIYHLLKYYQSEIFAMQTGGAQPHVHPSDLNELQILYAKDIEEQQAIATILSDMDKEIADLEAQRDKYRLLKSGMMQKLLTGQIRFKTE